MFFDRFCVVFVRARRETMRKGGTGRMMRGVATMEAQCGTNDAEASVRRIRRAGVTGATSPTENQISVCLGTACYVKGSGDIINEVNMRTILSL